MPNRMTLIASILLAIPYSIVPDASAQAPQSSPLVALQKLASNRVAALDIAQVALVAAKETSPGLDIQAYRSQLDTLARKLSPKIAQAAGLESKLAAMADAIYRQGGLASEPVLPPTVFVGLNDVLDKRSWNCFGMTVLYLALGERLGIPLRMVSGHGHVFIKAPGPPVLYVETTQQGRVYKDKSYLKSYLPYPCVNPQDYTVLNARQAAAVIAGQTGLALQNKNRWRNAQSYYECALRFDPGQPDAQAGIGFALLAQHKVDDAIAAFQRCRDKNPKYREAYGGLVEALHAKGDLDGALRACRELVRLCADEPKAQFNLGQLLYEKGDLDDAVTAYRKYTVLAPNDPEGYARLAFPLEDKGDLNGAVKAYRKALALNPRFTDAYINLGNILEKQKDVNSAVAAYRSALNIDPNNSLAMDGMGRALTTQGRLDEAIGFLRKAANLDPSNGAIWIDYGNALYKNGAVTDAVTMFRRAIDKDATDPEAYLALANALHASGDAQGAAAAAVKARGLGATLPPPLQSVVNTPASKNNP